MNTLDFKAYVGGKGITVDRNGLGGVKTPHGSGRWAPVPHLTLVTELERALAPHNIRIVNETYKLDKAGDRMFGLLQMQNCQENSDFSFVAGIRNSHDKKIRAGVAMGTGVYVCSNLSFKGEIVIGRKHTTKILDDLPSLVTDAVVRLAEGWSSHAEHIETYKNTDLSVSQGRDILIECAKQEVFPRSQFMEVLNEFESPRHPEFQDRNLWSLTNAVTEMLKPSENSNGGTLWLLPSRTEKLHQVCNELVFGNN